MKAILLPSLSLCYPNCTNPRPSPVSLPFLSLCSFCSISISFSHRHSWFRLVLDVGEPLLRFFLSLSHPIVFISCRASHHSRHIRYRYGKSCIWDLGDVRHRDVITRR